MRTLVTGASSGIGRALALRLAEGGDRLVLVARDGDSLTALRAQLPGLGHDIHIADLSTPQGVGSTAALLRATDDPIEVLVHSAGIGLPAGGYLGNDVAASRAVNALSIDAPLELVHAALPGMLDRGRGGVITVGSIAGFLPGSPALSYAAAKAWAHAFGEGLHELTRGTGVTSTVVAPGFVRSGFHDRAGITASGIPAGMWLTPELVADRAVRAFERRRALCVPGAQWKAVYAATRITPRSWSRAAFARYMAWTARRAR